MRYGRQAIRTVGLAILLCTCAGVSTEHASWADANTRSTPPSFYVAFPSAHEIGLVDPSSGEIEEVIPFTGGPFQMVVDPARPIVYVVLDGQQIVAFQTKYKLPIGSVMLPASCGSYAINGSGSKIYATSCAGNQTIYIANTKTFTITGSIQMQANVSGLAISNRRHRLYAVLPSLHSAAIINVDNDQIERVKYLGQCRINACSPDAAVVSPDDRYLISLDERQCETIEYDLKSNRVVGRTPDYVGRYCSLIGADAFTNQLWLESGATNFGRYASVTMDPPFTESAIFSTQQRIFSVAFSPSGVGFGVGKRPVPLFRSRDILVAFPTFSRTISLWSIAAGIVYVP